MNRQQQKTIAALTTAGVLWGLTVPLSKLSLAWLSPAWLAAARFTVAAALLGWIARRELRTALRPAVLATGAVGFGGAVLLQNLGIEQTSVSHAAVVIGAVPVLVAVLSAGRGPGTRRIDPGPARGRLRGAVSGWDGAAVLAVRGWAGARRGADRRRLPQPRAGCRRRCWVARIRRPRRARASTRRVRRAGWS